MRVVKVLAENSRQTPLAQHTRDWDARPANTKAASAGKDKLELWPEKPAAVWRRGGVLGARCCNLER